MEGYDDYQQQTAAAPDAPAAEHEWPAAIGDSATAATNGMSNGHGAAAEDGFVDARIAWRAENAKVLQKRDDDEKAAMREVESAAQAHLAKFYEERDARIAKAKEANRAEEEAATTGPTGDTDWAKVMSMIDFTFNSGSTKEAERERFKGLLFAAKEKNVPCM